MPMMQVGIGRVPVRHGLMAVNMRVRLPGGIVRAMFMLVVLIVNVAVGVLHRLVDMLVLVLLREVEV